MKHTGAQSGLLSDWLYLSRIAVVSAASNDPVLAGIDIADGKAGVGLNGGFKEAQHILGVLAFCGHQIDAQTRWHVLAPCE